MNIILFEEDEIGRPLERDDARAHHLLHVLRRQPNEPFDAGVVNGPIGKGRITCIENRSLTWTFEAKQVPPSPFALTLLLGAPRPIVARRILRDTTTLGVGRIIVSGTDRGEPSYLRSRLWSNRGWRSLLLDGAAQAFTTRIPTLDLYRGLHEAIEGVEAGPERLALDNYEPSCELNMVSELSLPLVIAVGSERGWSDRERRLLRAGGFTLASLGERVLRTETACIVGLGVVLAAVGSPSPSAAV